MAFLLLCSPCPPSAGMGAGGAGEVEVEPCSRHPTRFH